MNNRYLITYRGPHVERECLDIKEGRNEAEARQAFRDPNDPLDDQWIILKVELLKDEPED